jgi:peptidoglycan/LPS O-acetylase OafA/YrhL
MCRWAIQVGVTILLSMTPVHHWSFFEFVKSMSTDVSRMPVVDALKAIACLMIVLHHLSAYGPMSDVAGCDSN